MTNGKFVSVEKNLLKSNNVEMRLSLKKLQSKEIQIKYMQLNEVEFYSKLLYSYYKGICIYSKENKCCATLKTISSTLGVSVEVLSILSKWLKNVGLINRTSQVFYNYTKTTVSLPENDLDYVSRISFSSEILNSNLYYKDKIVYASLAYLHFSGIEKTKYNILNCFIGEEVLESMQKDQTYEQFCKHLNRSFFNLSDAGFIGLGIEDTHYTFEMLEV